MKQYAPLTDSEWQQLEPLFSKSLKRGRGKPHAPWRNVINSIFTVLVTGTKWDLIPKSEEFSTKSVSHRWFALWSKSGFLDELTRAYQQMTGNEVLI